MISDGTDAKESNGAMDPKLVVSVATIPCIPYSITVGYHVSGAPVALHGEVVDHQGKGSDARDTLLDIKWYGIYERQSEVLIKDEPLTWRWQ